MILTLWNLKDINYSPLILCYAGIPSLICRKITMVQSRNILLGSQSPRRSFLLEESGFEFRIETIDVDESFPDSLAAENVAEYISQQKALAYKSLLKQNEIGVVADTIVHLNGEILGKPKSKEDAKEMLGKMSGKKHDVFTGVTLFDSDHSISFTGHSKVYFFELSEEEIDYYIEKCQPYDKAGSYGIQEWIGYVKIEKIEGTYSTIMGLPVEMVYEELRKF